MDVADVALEVGRDAELSLAVLALVRLFAGVRAKVTRQIGRAREHLAAVAASVPERHTHAVHTQQTVKQLRCSSVQSD